MPAELQVFFFKGLSIFPEWAISIWRPDVILYQQGEKCVETLPAVIAGGGRKKKSQVLALGSPENI